MRRLGNAAGRRLTILRLQVAALLPRWSAAPSQPVSVMGLEFRNPLGVAAGFDRDGRLLPLLEAAGFGFVEIGTVTREGAREASERLAATPARHCRVAVNIGSLRSDLDATVADDYRACLRQLAPVADILVVNLSCRRMARLCGANAAGLANFLAMLRVEANLSAKQMGRRVRLAVKVEMAESESALVVEAAIAARLDALVAVGGDVAALAAHAAPLAVIAVGGIGSRVDVAARLDQGAALVEVYSALIRDASSAPRRLLMR